uniref:NF-kappa-B inhibitor delta-like n=1 Tax=Nothoprocta perdicaria TaxID=30464 RepID=A0A8C6YUS4_NOTPE
MIGVFIYCLRVLHIYAAKGMRAYTLAAAERMKEMQRLDAKEHRGKTPLLVAVTARQPAIVYDLIQMGADVNAVDYKGQSALHLAATYGFAQVLQVGKAFLVLITNNINLAGRDFCPLDLYSVFRLLCKAFLTLCCSSVCKQDVKSNKTVLHYTVQDGNISLLRYFLELNPFKSKDFVNSKAHGNTALHMAAALQHDKNQKEIIQLLLDHGADPSIRNLDNDQPIHMTPSGKAGDQIRHLLKKGRVASAFVSCRRNARS